MHEHEARTFLDELKERMRQFELALHILWAVADETLR
jgi:hypothetical protein